MRSFDSDSDSSQMRWSSSGGYDPAAEARRKLQLPDRPTVYRSQPSFVYRRAAEDRTRQRKDPFEDAPKGSSPFTDTPPVVVSNIKNRHNIEAIHLYREIIRTAKAFSWANDDGVPWSKVLVESARKEIEAAREEKDPEVLARLLVSGRDCLMEVQNRFLETRDKMMNVIHETRTDRKGIQQDMQKFDGSYPSEARWERR